LALALSSIAGGIAGCSSSGKVDADSSAASPLANVDPANTRTASSSLEAENVSDLAEEWSQPISGKGAGTGFTASPVVADGRVYLEDQNSNVRATDLSNGQVVWEKRYEVPLSGGNGVVVAGGRVLGATPTTAFALDSRTGKEIWSRRLVRGDAGLIAMTPGYHDGIVYLSTKASTEEGGEAGVLWALDAESGEKIWQFNTVSKGLWGRPDVNFGGGLTQPPAFDGEGFMYIGTGNPGPIPGNKRYPWGSSRPGPNLYTNSVVKLDEKTGRVKWYYQVSPHGICNWDVGAPLLTETGGRKIVIAGGLSGIVVALDQKTGKLLWRRPVGIHNGHDHDGLIAMRGEYDRLKTPMLVYPGVYGGVAGSIALEESKILVPVVNSPTRLSSQEGAQVVGTPTGELVALDVATGAVEWKAKFPSPLYGPVLTTNDVVFATRFDGWVYAFDADSGSEIWRDKLPSYAEGGLTAVGDTLLVRAGFPAGEYTPKLVVYRLGAS
jgi:outer membrane protein assembly factor BamB